MVNTPAGSLTRIQKGLGKRLKTESQIKVQKPGKTSQGTKRRLERLYKVASSWDMTLLTSGADYWCVRKP